MGHLPEAHAAKAEVAVERARTAADLAAVAMPRGEFRRLGHLRALASAQLFLGVAPLRRRLRARARAAGGPATLRTVPRALDEQREVSAKHLNLAELRERLSRLHHIEETRAT